MMMQSLVVACFLSHGSAASKRNKNKFKEHFNYKTVERVRELTIIKVFVLIAIVLSFPPCTYNSRLD